MNRPYGENLGDIWTGEGSLVQEQLAEEGSGKILIHEMHNRGGTVEEVLYVTTEPGLVARARQGDKVFGTVLCPRCERERYWPYDTTHEKGFSGDRDGLGFSYPALSRVDNATYVCTPCGQDEAMRDFAGEGPIPPDEWPIGMRESGEFGVGGRFA